MTDRRTGDRRATDRRQPEPRDPGPHVRSSDERLFDALRRMH